MANEFEDMMGLSEPEPENDPLLDDEDLDPRDSPTKPQMKGNPLAKAGLVGGGLFLAVVIAGIFLSDIFAAGAKIGQSTEQPATEQIEEPAPEPEPEDPTGELKTQLALAQQAHDIKELENKEETQLTPPEQPPATPTPTLSPPPPRPLPPPPVTSAPRQTTPTAPPPTEAERFESSMERWQALNTAGSFRGANSVVSPENQSTTDTPELLARAEQRVFDGSQVRRAEIGQSVTGTITMPLVWLESESDRRFVVILSEDLTHNGRVTLAQGTPIIFSLNGIDSNGLVDASALSTIVDGIEVQLPDGAIALRGGENAPLIASNANQGGGHEFERMVLGAVESAGQAAVGNQNLSVSSGDFNFSSSGNGGSNQILGGAISGAAGQLLDVIQDEIDRENEAAKNSGAPLWVLPKGQAVTLYINAAIDF